MAVEEREKGGDQLRGIFYLGTVLRKHSLSQWGALEPICQLEQS